MSYFAKSHFIIYDEWFDENLENTRLDIQNSKSKTITNMHEFFYEASNYKIGASENYLQLDKKINEKQIFTNDYHENTSIKFPSRSNENFWCFEKLTKSKFKFKKTKKLVFSLLIFGFSFILGYLLIDTLQSRKNEPNITNKLFSLKKEFYIS